MSRSETSEESSTRAVPEPVRHTAGSRPSAYARGLRRCGHALKVRALPGEHGRASVVLGLLVVWLAFQAADSHFLSPRNLSGISVDMVGIGMIALGLVFVLALGQIDLSLGSVAGLATVVFTVLNVHVGASEGIAVLLAVLSGAAIGTLQGFIHAKSGIPAYVVTLAGLLGWYGLTLYLLGSSGTINFNDTGLVASLTSSYFSNPAAAYGLAAIGTAAFLLISCQNRRRHKAAGMPSRPLRTILLRTGALAAVAFAAAIVLNAFQGLPLALLIFLAAVAVVDYLLRRMPYGRKVFALGSAAEAARRAGINVALVRMSVFTISGTMAAIGGLFLASPTASTIQPSSSPTLLLSALAAAVLGGASLFGARGTSWSALLGILIIQSIASGVALVGIPAALQFIITAGVLLAAVLIDSTSRRTQRAHGLA
ncbi:sugar ABC transporter permease [Streptomyces himalayensis]|uniref:Xylose transport system permease protein XylH n=1 Tax=Streptomyces himalayensis subsp. himalayensis TaxID=2756131 RepID=A0A7W0ICR4_9ACTN|nr:sugar ABC transporter permease [Streptomyces himalayensis]MBA2950421.1 sugar ABC transporter permease [Streptomyces himalayensis subsp. himalayensis]